MTQEGIVVATLVAGAGARAQAPEVRLHAAGNLHAAMLELARSYRAAGGAEVTRRSALQDRCANADRRGTSSGCTR